MIVQWNSVFKLILSGLCHLKRGNVEKIDYFKMPSVSVSQSIYTLKSSFYRDFSCLRHAIWRCFTQANSKWVISINQILCLHYVASVTVMGCSLGTKKSFICIDKWRFFFKLIFLWKSLTASPLHKTEHNVIHLMLQIANLKTKSLPSMSKRKHKTMMYGTMLYAYPKSEPSSKFVQEEGVLKWCRLFYFPMYAKATKLA